MEQKMDIEKSQKMMAQLSVNQSSNSQISGKVETRRKRCAKAIENIVIAKKASNYYWNNLQNKRYVTFLTYNAHLFSLSEQQRRLQKINLQMSKKVRTRNPTQCHTHHQKMMKKFGNIPNIIKNLQIPEGTIEDIPESPQLVPQGIPQLALQPPKEMRLEIEPLKQYQYAPIYPVIFDLFGEEMILGRFQNLQQVQEKNWFSEQELQSWMN